MKEPLLAKLVNKHLVGRKIIKVKWMTSKRDRRIFGWMQQPCLDVTWTTELC